MKREGGEKSNKTNRRIRHTISSYTASTPHLCLLMASQHILFKSWRGERVTLVAPLCKFLWGLVEKDKQGLLEVVEIKDETFVGC
jgi:hypothetical protein